MTIKQNYTKIIITITLITSFSTALANYNSQIKQIDQLINRDMKRIKSTEKLVIPEYKGDMLTFERLSKIKNIFDMSHLLPFEKIKKKVPKKIKKKKVKLKPITVPKPLQEIMSHKETRLQQYPLESFSFKGFVKQDNADWGVVENSREPKPLYLSKGELIGSSYGRVAEITKEGVLVKEWQKDEKQRVWKQTQAVIR